MSEEFQDGITPPPNPSDVIEKQAGLNAQVENGGEGDVLQAAPPQSSPSGTQDGQDDEPQPQENEFIGRPDAYVTDEISLPEGMELNQEVLKGFSDFATQVNLSQKGYNEAVNMGIKLVEDTRSRMLEAFKASEEQKILGYQRETFNDKEIGGDRLQQSISEAATAYRKFATPDVQEILAQTGLEHHPALIKMFRRISAEMDDDIFAGGGSVKTNEIPREQKMFPDMFTDQKS